MKKFTRIEPTKVYEVGEQFKRQIVMKNFQTDDGLVHNFTTYGREGDQSVFIVALTPERQVLLVRQFRPGAEDWQYDVPCGMVEEGESLEEAAIRELAEETGRKAGTLEKVGAHTYGYFNERMHIYFATDCTVLENPPKADGLELEQGIEYHKTTISDALQLAKNGKFSAVLPIMMAYDRLIELEGKNTI